MPSENRAAVHEKCLTQRSSLRSDKQDSERDKNLARLSVVNFIRTDSGGNVHYATDWAASDRNKPA